LGRKERYVLAMALLLAIGLSVAWAGYSTAAIATISTGTGIGSFASVQKSSSLSLSNLKKNNWFYKNLGSVFTINNVNTNLTVVVGVINMAELQNYFKSLDINVSLKKDGTVKDWGVLSLEGGTSSVILNATVSQSEISQSQTIEVEVYVQGLPSVTTSSVKITMYCAIEPAKAVQA